MKNNALTTHGSNKFLTGFFSVTLSVLALFGFGNVAQADNKMPSSPSNDSTHALVVTAPATQQLKVDIQEQLPIVLNAQPAEASNALGQIAPEPTVEPTVMAATPSQPTAANENRLSDQETQINNENLTPREPISVRELQQDFSTNASVLSGAPSNTSVQPSQEKILSLDDTTGIFTLGTKEVYTRISQPDTGFRTTKDTFGGTTPHYVSPAVETCKTNNGVKSCESFPAGIVKFAGVVNGSSITVSNQLITRVDDPFADTTRNILNTRFGNASSAVPSLGGDSINLVSLSPQFGVGVGSDLNSINVNGGINLGSDWTLRGKVGLDGSYDAAILFTSGPQTTTFYKPLPLTPKQEATNKTIGNMSWTDRVAYYRLQQQHRAQLSASKVQNPTPPTQTALATPTRPSPLLTRNDVARLVPEALRKNPEATLKLLQQSLGNASRGIIAAYTQTGSGEKAALVASQQVNHLTAQLLPLSTQPAGLASLAERLQKLANPPTVTTENAQPQAETPRSGTAMLASLEKLCAVGGLSKDEYDEICMRAGHFPGTGATASTRRLVIDAVRATLNLSDEQNPAEALRERATAARVIAAMQNNNAQNG